METETMAVHEFSPVFLVGLLGLILLGIVLAVALVKGRARSGVLGAIVVTVLVSSLLAIATMVGVRHRRSAETGLREAQTAVARDVAVEQQRRTARIRSNATRRTRTPDGSEATEVVQTGTDGPGSADVYPSPELAAAGVMKDAARALESVTQANSPPPTAYLVGDAPRQVLDAAAAALRTHGLVRHVEVQQCSSALMPSPPTGPSGTADVVTCELELRADGEQIVRATVRGPRGQLTRSASYVDKPWAADPGPYLSYTKDRNIVAQSRRQHANPQLAMHDAMDDAAAQLLPHVRRGIRRAVADGQLDPRAEMPDGRLREMIVDRVHSGELIVDRFASRSRRSYGDVWRQSLLIDASPHVMDRLAINLGGQAMAYRNVQFGSWSKLALSIGGILLLILLVYLLLNAATKGYYVWILRLVAVILAAALAAALTHLMA